MRKEFLFIFLALTLANTVKAQTKGTKVGYIDMEYILQNVPDYTEAQSQLEQKAQKWKQEIEAKKNEINKLKEALKAEKALLTKGLIEERISEIVFLENENLEYQQKRFGPNGDLMTQKNALTKPIQDQVFTITQDIAERKKYDFILDKSSDMTMLFAAKRYDISDEIVRQLNRTEKREQLTKKQLKEEADREAKEDAIADNPALSDRQKALDAKKLARETVIANRKLADEERRKAAEDKKLKIIADREAKKNGTAPSVAKTTTTTGQTVDKEAAATAAAQAKQAQADQRAETLRTRQQAVEDKKKALEERRQQILDEREAKKAGIIPAANKTTETAANPDTKNEAAKTAAVVAAETKQKQADARAKTLEDRKKVAEENKKAQEEKRKKALNAKKTGTVSENTEKEGAKTPTTAAETAKTQTETAVTKDTAAKTPAEEAKQKQAEARAKAIDDRNKVIEERKKALEEKKKKILEDREAIKKANEEKLKTTKENTNNN